VNREKGRRVVLWRHGRTEWNADGRFQGQTDIDLDETGRDQAMRAARLLAALGPELIVTSDLRRAVDTAAELGKLVGKTVEQDSRLRETYAGEWQGLTGAEIAARYPGEYSAWRAGDPELKVGGGESRADVAARMADAITDAAARLPESGLAVLVTHGGAARLGVARLVGLPLERFTNLGGLSNGSWSMLTESSHGWVLIEHNAGTLPEPVSIEEG
jgi:glucosyl-3-phosphoglycerate phosphatase